MTPKTWIAPTFFKVWGWGVFMRDHLAYSRNFQQFMTFRRTKKAALRQLKKFRSALREEENILCKK